MNRDTDAEFNKLREEANEEEETNHKDGESEDVPPPSDKKKTPKKRAAGRANATSEKESAKKLKSILVKNKDDEEMHTPSPKRKRKALSDTPNDVSTDNYHSATKERRNNPVSALLNRPVAVARPDTPEIDMSSVSNALQSRNIQASSLKFGFLGLGIMGGGIVKNLINSGHSVVVWNRTSSKVKNEKNVFDDLEKYTV